MKLRAIVGVCLAGAAALPSPRKSIVGRSDERSAGRAEVDGLDQRQPKERRVIGGLLAKGGEFPWVVSLGYCGGTLINPQWVLTAAHCVDEPKRQYPWREKSVVIGALDKRYWQWPRENYGYRPERIDVDDIVIPDEWYDLNGPHDIALLHLARPSKLPPVKLAETSPAVDDNVLLIGWGDTIFGPVRKSSDVLRKADLKVVDNSRCVYHGDDGTEFCAGDTPGQQSQGNGDSGGPVVVERDGEYYQVGVVSRSSKSDFYGTLTDVSAHQDWIDETMDNWEPKTCEDQSSDCDARCCPGEAGSFLCRPLDCGNSGKRCLGTWSAENCRATCGLVCSDAPTPRPVAGPLPTERPTACADDPTWCYGNCSPNDCLYVARKVEPDGSLTRCKASLVDDQGRSPLDMCPATCGTCSAPTLRGSYSV